MATYGWRPDPRTETDPYGDTVDLVAKDWNVKDFLAKAPPKLADGDVDLSKYATDTNQWSLSSCAGNATADSVEILDAIEEEDDAKADGRAPVPQPQLSRLFVYNMARERAGELALDEGTYIRYCFDVLARFGICEENVWPYDEAKVFTSPTLKAQRRALGHKIHGFYRIKSTEEQRLDDIVAALRAKHPVVFGTLIDHTFQADNGPTVIGPPGSVTIGGHAMIVVGYVGGLFKVKNSWGPGWRDKGYCLMKPEYLAWDETQDLWVPTLAVHF